MEGKLLLGTLDVTMAHISPFDCNDSKKYFLLGLFLNPTPLNLTLFIMSGMVWGGYVLNTVNWDITAPFCKGGQNHTWLARHKHIEWLPRTSCSFVHLVLQTEWTGQENKTLKAGAFLSPKGGILIRGTILWPYLPYGWTGHYTLAFPSLSRKIYSS